MQEPLLERRLCANGRMEWRFQDHEARQKSLAMSSDLALHGIEIRSAGNGSGLGVFALRPFQPGARIFGESPLVQWTSADQVECPGVSYAWLQRQLERLPPADQAAYAALYASPAHADKGPALAIWISNAYPGEEDGDGDSAAVFCIGSRFNHGCSANCATSWDSRLRRQMYHAVKPIGSGEEITVNYLGQAGHVQGRDARMAGLRKVGFECSCALCVLSTSARIASDARRSRMASLRSQLEQERRRGAEGGLYEHCACLLEKLLSLMREESSLLFLTSPWFEPHGEEGIAEVWAHGAILDVIVKAWKTGHKSECSAWTRRWIAELKVILGDDLDVKAKVEMLFHELNG